ncbi:Apoptosis-associated speck-like protein containing a CARD [Lemmus lemmus]
MGQARDAILDALENLTADELKKFKMKLLSVPLREGYGRIPRGILLTMDVIDLTDKIVSFYLESYGTELTMTVLRDMGMQELAEQLQTDFEKGECGCACPATLNFLHPARRPASLALSFLLLQKQRNLPFVALNLAPWVEGEPAPDRLLITEKNHLTFLYSVRSCGSCN